MEQDKTNSFIKFFLLHFEDLNIDLEDLKEKALQDYNKGNLTASEHCDVEMLIDFLLLTTNLEKDETNSKYRF